MLILAVSLIGCLKTKPPSPAEAGPDPAVIEALEGENRALKKTLTDRERVLKKKDALISRLQLQLLESDARYKVLTDQIASQQIILDEAVVEVVRTKAKLRSIESRAEAASSIAEAEIALKGLKESMAAANQEPPEDFIKAESLLRMSSVEFGKENYGGALYLAGQTQSLIRVIQSKVSHEGGYAPAPGEILFTQPLPLKVLKRSNLRQTPSLKSTVVETLADGTLIIGFSYKEEWVRVRAEDGASGWIFHTLVGGR
jgi:myosin heavy subunit